MLFNNIAILTEDGSIKNGQYVTVDDGRISYVGEERPGRATVLGKVVEKNDIEKTAEEYDGTGKLIIPGFYNAHAHTPMTLLRGYGENLSLHDWLNKKIFPFEARLDSNAVYWGTLLGIAESFKYGIVSTTDMYYFCDDMLRAYEESGAKVNISRAITNAGDDDNRGNASFTEARRLYENYHESNGGKTMVDMSLHAEYTSTKSMAFEVAEFAREKGANVHIHLSETKSEHEECKTRHEGMTPAAYFDSVALFDTKCTAAHCVWVEDTDIDIFKMKNVTVASCPVSNMKLASGICDVAGMISNGLNVAIGTDSVASNNNLCMFEEMKVFALGAKIKHMDPVMVTPKQALSSATVNGAIAQGRGEDCGSIKEGYKADLIVLDLDKPNARPIHDIETNLLYSLTSDSIVLTMVDGNIVYKDGEYTGIDIEKVIFEAERATKRILADLNQERT